MGFCAQNRGEKRKSSDFHHGRQRIRANINRLLDRILLALDSDAVEKIEKVLNSANGNIVVVGTGGSFSAAVFIAKCISQFHPCSIAKAYRPRDVLIRGFSKVNRVILLSYSGMTKDIQNVYKACKIAGVKVNLISNLQCDSDAKFYETNDVISYRPKNGTRERGFLSMAGTLIPMALFGEIYYKGEESFRNFLASSFSYRSQEFEEESLLQNVLERNLIVDVYSGADTLCASTDLESKFVEAGLGRVTIHEKKDFSHGRFTISDEYPPNMVIFLDNIHGLYSEKLLQYVKKHCQACFVHLNSTQESFCWGDFELVVAAEFFACSLSKKLDYDMASPAYSKDAMSLYKYSGKSIL